MSDNTTIARPYAKAVFECAQTAHQLSEWSAILQQLAEAALNHEVSAFLENPAATTEQQVSLLLAVLAKVNKESTQNEQIKNFIRLLAQNKRLPILSDITVQYEFLRAEQEKTLSVKVLSFSPLTSAQEKNLIQSLEKRLKRHISLDVNIDKALLGGAVIYAGDLVIDGSVRGRLNKLESDLAA